MSDNPIDKAVELIPENLHPYLDEKAVAEARNFAEAPILLKDLLKQLTFRLFTDEFLDEFGHIEPGAVVKTNKDIYLVGDINTQKGFCDDCTFSDDEKIIEIAHISELFKS